MILQLDPYYFEKNYRNVNLKVVGIVVAILFFATTSSFTNYVFAQTSDLGSQMQTARNTAMAGMNQVKSAMKSGGLKSGMESAKDVMKSSMTSSLGTVNNKTNPEKAKLQSQTEIKQKTIGSATNVDDNKMKHFEQIRDNLMHSKFKPNPSAKAI